MTDWGPLGVAAAAVVGAVSIALYRRRRTQIRGWVLLVGEMQERLDTLHKAVEAAERRIETALLRAESAESQARDAQARATRLGLLHDAAVAHIEALWQWIEAGATPPAPSLPTVLLPYVSLPHLARSTDAD